MAEQRRAGAAFVHSWHAGTEKLLPLPKELQLNTEPELPPEPEKTVEDEAAAPPAFEPLTTEEEQEAAEVPEDLAAEETVPSVTVETTEEAAVPAIEQEPEPAVSLPEEPLDSPVAEVDEEDDHQDSPPPVQELTPIAQKKIVQLFPDRKKIKVAPPEQRVPVPHEEQKKRLRQNRRCSSRHGSRRRSLIFPPQSQSRPRLLMPTCSIRSCTWLARVCGPASMPTNTPSSC